MPGTMFSAAAMLVCGPRPTTTRPGEEARRVLMRSCAARLAAQSRTRREFFSAMLSGMLPTEGMNARTSSRSGAAGAHGSAMASSWPESVLTISVRLVAGIAGSGCAAKPARASEPVKKKTATGIEGDRYAASVLQVERGHQLLVARELGLGKAAQRLG